MPTKQGSYYWLKKLPKKQFKRLVGVTFKVYKLMVKVLEAMRMLEEGVASPQDIDTAIKLGLNHPMGPLELADYVGLDTMLFISDSMTEAMGERFRAPQTLRKLVEAGRLGRKTGQGFYSYDN